MFRPPTKYSEYLQDVRKSIDYILSRVNSTTVGTLQQVTNAGSTTTNAITTGGITTDYVQLNTLATPTLAPGMFAWNDAFGTADLRLKGGNVTLQLGQETLARVVNKTGADLLESQYRVVRVRIASEGGSQGQRLAVVLAQGNNDPDSVTTLGIVTETILNNQEGFITVFGNVNNIDTTGSLQGETWLDGDVLYLSPTIPGALTKVKPIAPNHSVTMGYVIYAHGVNGKIFVKVDNGYELDELHNVRITAVANNDLLQYDSVQQVWKNVAASVAVPTPTLAQVTTAGNTTTNAVGIGVGVGDPLDFQFVVQGVIQVRSGASSFSGLRIDSSSIRRRDTGTFSLGTNDSTSFNIFAPTNNIGINTTTDAGYKLDVNGNTAVRGILYVTDTVGTPRAALQGFDNNEIQLSVSRWVNSSTATLDVNGFNINTSFYAPIKGAYGVSAGNNNISMQPGRYGFIGRLFATSSALGGGETWAIKASAEINITDGSTSAGTVYGVLIDPTLGTLNNVTYVALRSTVGNVQLNTTSGNTLIGTTTDSNAKFVVAGSSTAASLIARGVYFNNTLVAAANNDVLVGLDINPTFTNGAFTGVQNYALRLTNSPAFFGGDPVAMFITNNASIRGNATTGGILYIDGSRDLTGTIRLRASAIDISGATSVGALTATAITVNGTNSVSLVTGTGVTSFRIGNTTSSSIWYFENNRSAPAGSLEITNGLGSAGMTFFSSRNVAINSNTDAGYKLDVNGTARISGALTIANPANTIGLIMSGFYTAGAIQVTNGNPRGFITTINGNADAGYLAASNVANFQGVGYQINFFRAGNAINITNPIASSEVVGFHFNPTISGQGTSSIYGFRSLLAGAANRWNLYIQGTALNYIEGNVLVNTSTDAGYKLDVNGTGRFTNNLSIAKSYNVTWGTNQQINVTDYPAYYSSGYNVMSFISSSSGAVAEDGSFVWRNVGTSSNLMVLTGKGSLGLGTTPTEKLHIVDNTTGNKFARISAGAADASAAWVAQNDQVDNIVYRVFGSGVAGFQMGIALARSASLIANLDGTGKFLIGTYSNTDIIFGTGDQSRIRVSGSNGNVMIGTLTDIGTKLNVSGEINSAGYRVNNVFGWSGTINIPTTPPISITVDGGIITNVV